LARQVFSAGGGLHIPDLFKLCELRSANQEIVGSAQHIELIDTITSGLKMSPYNPLYGIAVDISRIIANYARKPLFEVRAVINGNKFSVATVYELPFSDFPNAPIFIGGLHAQFWFTLSWFIEPAEIIVTSRTGIMRGFDDIANHDAGVTMPCWNLRKQPWSFPALIDPNHPTIRKCDTQ
jgi:hypothetical protein